MKMAALKQFSRGKIDDEMQARLDAMQAKIDEYEKECAALEETESGQLYI